MIPFSAITKLNNNLLLKVLLFFTVWTFCYDLAILANTLKLVFAIRTPCDSSFVTWFKIFVEIKFKGADSFFIERATRKNIKRHFAVLGSVKWIISFRYIVKCLWNANKIHTHHTHLRFKEYRLFAKRVKKSKKKVQNESFELNIP